MQILKEKNISIASHIYSIGNVCDTPFDAVCPKNQMESLIGKDFSVIDDSVADKMKEVIESARLDGDSVGGVVETSVVGVAAGFGEHIFSGVEGRISSIIFGIPAVKGIEFGLGFGSASIRGSENNDPYYTDGKNIYTKTNNAGGIIGGMTSGMPVIFRAAVKPTPSISREQDSVSLSKMENVKLSIVGRHDPCIVPRSVPVFESCAAIAIMDMLLDS